MAISNLVTSAHCVAYINSVAFARCSGLSVEIATPRKEIRGIDVLQPVEIIPTGLSMHGTLQVYKMHDDAGAEAMGLLATWEKATKEKYFSLMVLDRATDGVIFQVGRCCVVSQSWNISPKQFVMGSITWTGFDYSNNAE